MMSCFFLVGQLGFIKRLDNGSYSIEVYLNKYSNKSTNVKLWSLPIECIAPFKPRHSSGASVVVEGEFVPSKNSSNGIEFRIRHIGAI